MNAFWNDGMLEPWNNERPDYSSIVSNPNIPFFQYSSPPFFQYSTLPLFHSSSLDGFVRRSFPWKRESRGILNTSKDWIAACAGMTENSLFRPFTSPSVSQYSNLPLFHCSSSYPSSALFPGFIILFGSKVLLIRFISPISTESCSNVI